MKASSDSVQGFSLAELVVTMACAAILFTAAVPNIVRLHQEWKLWGSIRSLEGSMCWGRMHAISANTSLLFMVDADQGKFYWVDPASGDPYESSIRYLSDRVRITAFPRRPLRFFQHGNAAPAGTYKIEGEAGSYSIIVAPGGRIRLEKN